MSAWVVVAASTSIQLFWCMQQAWVLSMGHDMWVAWLRFSRGCQGCQIRAATKPLLLVCAVQDVLLTVPNTKQRHAQPFRTPRIHTG